METSAGQKQRQRKDILQGMIDISIDITAGSVSINCIEQSLKLPLTPSPSPPRCIRLRVPDHYREFSFVVAPLISILKQSIATRVKTAGNIIGIVRFDHVFYNNKASH